MTIEYSTVTEDQLVLRQRVLLILFKNFGEGKYSNQSIYECADDWCSKQVTTNGLVSYFKAYYGKYERQEGSKENYQDSKTTS